MKNIRMIAAAALLLAATALSAQPKVKHDQGGDRLNVKSGGHLQVDTGATVTLFGGTLNTSGSQIDAVANAAVNGAIQRIKVISITTTPTGSEQDTGWDIPVNALVEDVAILTTTTESTAADKRMHVGIAAAETGGDVDGFMAGVLVDTVGPTATTDTLSTTNNNEDWLAMTTRGALLGHFTAGSNSAGDVGTSVKRKWPALATKGRSLVYDVEGSDWAEWRGKIIVYYLEVN